VYTVPFEAVTNWINDNNFWLPQSVDFVCPFCSRKVNFGLGKWRIDNATNTATSSSNCSGCRKQVRFWAIDPAKFGNTGKQECEELCMHPTPTLEHRPMQGLENVPQGVARAYLSAVSVYNAKEWNGTAVLVGRALEGLVKSLMPEEKRGQTLSRMLNELPSTIDLTKTLTTLTDGLRKGRNLGAHFDLEKEANEEVAKMMIDFLEYFLEYLYILPGEVKSLHDRL
jgi:hypothetical protein